MNAFIKMIFGTWQSPPWVKWCMLRKVKIFIILISLSLLTYGGMSAWQWYKNLPQPHTVSYKVNAPYSTSYYKTSKDVFPLTVKFSESVAPTAQVGKVISSGIKLTPNITGVWAWINDKELVFKPADDWPIDEKLFLKLNKKGLLASHILLKEYEKSVVTPPFITKKASQQLYQDPTNPGEHKAITTLTFSHPVDPKSLINNVKVVLGNGVKYKDPQNTKPTVKFDDIKLKAYIQTAPIAVPLESSTLSITFPNEIKSILGGNERSISDIKYSVAGRYQLTFSSAKSQFVTNDKDEPEPVITFSSSMPVADDEIAQKTQAWLLPNKDHNNYWSIENITPDLLKTAQKVTLQHIPTEKNLNSFHSFKFNIPVGRTMLVQVDSDVNGEGGYLSRKKKYSIIKMQPYPKVLEFLGDGALLSLNDDRRVGFMTRGVKNITVEIAKINPDQLNQLVDQNNGNFNNPRIGNRAFDRIVDRTQISVYVPEGDPRKIQYSDIDLSEYLHNKSGIFVLKITPTDQTSSRTFNSYSDNQDLRFIMATDLGILTKNNADRSSDVFVQSLSTGEPVSEANVDIIAINGKSVRHGITDEQGHVLLADTSTLKRENTPLLYRVTKGNDMSFLPMGDWSRRLDYSRFDTGGINEPDPKSLSAYLFTERGLYRPGEKVHIAGIVKSQDWQTTLSGLPVEISINNPKYELVYKKTIYMDHSGFNEIEFTTSDAAIAGNYSVELTLVANKNKRQFLGGTSFKVRDFEPDKMKVKLALGNPKGWLKPADVTANLTAEQLFGGPAGERTVNGEVVFSPTDIYFSQWPNFRFSSSNALDESYRESIADTKTDKHGQATLELGLDRFADSTYKLHVLARVYEPNSGRNVSDKAELLVSNADYLLGYKADGKLKYLKKGSERNIQLQAINNQLKPYKTDINVERIEHRWVSVLIKQPNGTLRYESRHKEKSLDIQQISLGDTGASIAVDTSEPGDYELIFRDNAGNKLNSLRYTVAGNANVSRALERNAELQLTLDKSSYKAGDVINLSIKAPYVGAGLITIERDKVYSFKWFKTTTTSSVQQIQVPYDIEGNAYVNVQFLRSPDSKEIFMSPLSYAIEPFEITLDKYQQPLKLNMPKKVVPGSELKMELGLSSPSKVLVFGVDEGILQVARYKAPDPLKHFFRKRGLTVRSNQILDQLLPQLQMMFNNTAPGGDVESLNAANLNPFKRKRKEPVVYWSGLKDFAAGNHELTYQVPAHFNGKMHFFVVSVNANQIGAIEEEVLSKAPIVMSPNVPPFLAPGDTSQFTMSLYNTEKFEQIVTLSTDSSDSIEILDGKLQQFTIKPNEEAHAKIKVKATEQLGEAKLNWVLTASGKLLTMNESISVRPLTAYRTTLNTGMQTTSEIIHPLKRELFSAYGEKSAQFSSSPLIWANGLQTYLANYPYACTEQIMSKSAPALLMNEPAENQAGLDKLITQLRSRQNANGSFGLWSTNLVVEPIVTAYVVDMLLDIKEHNYHVPKDILENANRYLKSVANGNSDGFDELRVRSYALYLLARQGHKKSVNNAISDIVERFNNYYPDKWKSDIAAAWIASVYRIYKLDDSATPLFKKQKWQLLDGSPSWSGAYIDPMTHDAILLNLMSRYQPALLTTPNVTDKLLPKIGEWIAQQRYNSMSAAKMVSALLTYETAVPDGNLSLSEQNGDIWNALSTDIISLTANAVKTNKTGNAPAFYQITETGFDKTLAEPFNNGIEIYREYLDLDGKPIGELTVGDEVLVQIKVRSTKNKSIKQAVIVDLLPAGLEPVYNDGETGFRGWNPPIGVSSKTDFYFNYLNVREDRILIYGSLSNDISTFTYKARALNQGKFQIPPAYAQGLYNTQLQALGAGGSLTINSK